MRKPVYLDNQATTPMDPRVLEAMTPYFLEHFGNPHSTTHSYGWTAEAGVEKARRQIAAVIGADAAEIYFTSGATEANNLAVKGTMQALGAKRPHMVTLVSEHKCLLESARSVELSGYRVTYVPVQENGLVDLAVMEAAIGDETALVSVMAVNNEIGVIQPIAEIAEIAKARGAVFHSDAAQAFGKINLNVDTQHIDLMSLSGHKIYGPKGIGILYKRAERRVAVTPQMSGGGQEKGLRPGTLAPAQCVGFGEAAEIASREMAQEEGRLRTMMERLKASLKAKMPAVIINGDEDMRWVGNLNISFPGLDGELLLANLRDLALSSGAACASAVSGPSYVLKAIGVDERTAKASLRLGIGRFTTDEEIDFASETLIKTVTKMGGLKP